MLYKSKAKIVWLVLSIIFALGAIVLVIMNLALKIDLYLTIAIGLATLFFVSRGAYDYIDSKYCARKDQKFERTLSYICFSVALVCFVIFVVQLVFSLI